MHHRHCSTLFVSILAFLAITAESSLGGTCVSDADCDAAALCTADSCVAGLCVNVLEPADTACRASTGACDPQETCDGVNPFCPADVVEVDGSSCDDGLYCDGVETCLGGTCVSSGDPCAPAACDDVTDQCLGCVANAECSDGSFCNGMEVCIGGTCVGGTPPVCDDGNVCTDDSCNEAAQACAFSNNSAPCDDGDICTSGDACQSGICGGDPIGPGCTIASEAKVCAETAGHTADVTDGGAGATYVWTVTGGTLDNGNGTLSITYTAGFGPTLTIDVTVTDALGCSTSCQIIVDVNDCLPPCSSDADCDDDEPCTLDACAGGVCSYEDALDGIFCENGRYCTLNTTCIGGICSGGSPRECFDGIPCTVDVCDEIGDACDFVPNDAACGDGLYCNGAESCDLVLGCTPGPAVDCDDGSECTADTCVEQEGCIHTGIPGCCTVNADCDSGNACNIGACNMITYECEFTFAPPGTSCGSSAVTACTNPDACDGIGSCDTNHVVDGALCDDGDECTEGDLCVNGGCTGIVSDYCTACMQGGFPDDPANLLGFQSYLLDAAGEPVSGTVDLSFRFLNNLGGQEGEDVAIPDVPVADGQLIAYIPIVQTVFDGTGRYLEVSVNGSVLEPTIPITSAAQSFQTACVADNQLTDHLQLGSSASAGQLEIFGQCEPVGDGSAARVCSSSVSIDSSGVVFNSPGQDDSGLSAGYYNPQEFPCFKAESLLLNDCGGRKVELRSFEYQRLFSELAGC